MSRGYGRLPNRERKSKREKTILVIMYDNNVLLVLKAPEKTEKNERRKKNNHSHYVGQQCPVGMGGSHPDQRGDLDFAHHHPLL